jgi:predicted MFS family arabinose efflux permease
MCRIAGGTLLCGLAPSMNMLILARAIAGMVRNCFHAIILSLIHACQGGGGVMTGSSMRLIRIHSSDIHIC